MKGARPAREPQLLEARTGGAERLPWGLLACRNHPIVYVNMPKSACTTIKNILYQLDTGSAYPDPVGIHGDRSSLLRSHLPGPDFAAAFEKREIVFTFVREPFSRCYSAFNEKIYQGTEPFFVSIRETVARAYGGNFDSVHQPSPQEHAANFLAFLRLAARNIAGDTPRWAPNAHWLPQSAILARTAELCSVDVVGRVEDFEPGMRYVLELAGCAGQVDVSARYNEGPPPPYRLADIMTDEIHAALHHIYARDLAYFGYRCPTCGPASSSSVHPVNVTSVRQEIEELEQHVGRPAPKPPRPVVARRFVV